MTKTYRVCRSISRVKGADGVLCVVVAIPGSDADALEVESRIVSSEAAAHECCAALTREIGERIRSRGDQVSI
jgi:hypothetical protein